MLSRVRNEQKKNKQEDLVALKHSNSTVASRHKASSHRPKKNNNKWNGTKLSVVYLLYHYRHTIHTVYFQYLDKNRTATDKTRTHDTNVSSFSSIGRV